jgi:hypothetical protein
MMRRTGVNITRCCFGFCAQAGQAMGGVLIRKRFYSFKIADIAAYLLALTLVGTLFIHAAHAASVTPATTGPVAAVNVARVELHIVADGTNTKASELKTMESRLEADGAGPAPQPGDTIRWVEAERADDFDIPGRPRETWEWKGSRFVPVLVAPDASMDQSSTPGWNTPGWNFVSAHPQINPDGTHVIAFSFDARGAKLFGELTTRWSDPSSPHSRVAFIVGNKIISAPRILDPITSGSGIITGGGAVGFSEEETNRVIGAMNGGVGVPTTEPSRTGSP